MIQTFTYDDAARIQRVTTANNGAYKRYYYAATYIESWWSVNNVADEGYANQHFDGLKRVIATASIHPGSSGGYSGQLIVYDAMGRAVKQSNPTEIGANWVPTGDDAAGWLYTQQTYDWKGRPLVTTNTDGTTKEAIYGGCGCAGGEVVVTRDEVGRRQKTIFDALGRAWKNQILYQQDKSQALNGDGDIYSTTVNTYNALDQVTLMRQYQGADTSGVYQDTTAAFDGFARLWKKHSSEQQVDTNNSASTDHTTWNYNADDTIQKVTDARGVIANFTYNNRHMVTLVNYDRSNVPTSANVSAAANASFAYDAAGNRISMTDGLGSCTYNFNQLSQLVSETHHFNDLANSPTSGNYTLGYQYNLAGEVTNITDAFNVQVGYSYDQAARLNSVSNSGSANFSSQYLSNINYRAWGAMKDVDYGNGVHQHVNYNSRLLPSTSSVSNVSKSYPFTDSATLNWTYDYYADGRVHHAYDADDNRFDRSFAYDHAARISEADTNRRARGQSPDYWHPDPYQQTFGFDVWNNSTSRSGLLYNRMLSDSATYTNNRRSGWSYDADGAVTHDSSYDHRFDAVGQDISAIAIRTVGDGSTQWPERPELEITQSYDGNGQSLKRNQITRMNEYDLETGEFSGVDEVNQTTYYLRSSVLGGAIIDELGKDWQNNVLKLEGYVYAGGQRIAKQTAGQYEQHNPVTGSWVTTAANRYMNREERDPVGGQLPLTAPPSNSTYASQNFGAALFFIGGDPSDFSGGCVLDGLPTACSFVRPDAVKVDPKTSQSAAQSIGAVPIWDGPFCVCVGSDCECHNYIVGYTTPTDLSNLVPYSRLPQNEQELPIGHFNLDRFLKVLNLMDANKEAERRLQNPTCAALFNRTFLAMMDPIEVAEMEIYGTTPNFGLELLRQTHYRILDLGAPTYDPNTRRVVVRQGAATISWNDVWINSQGPFFNIHPNVPGVSSVTLDLDTGLGQTEFAAFMRLHELGHQVGLFGSDANDEARNRQYSQAVLDACFPEVRHRLR